jgi:hypothetical protein
MAAVKDKVLFDEQEGYQLTRVLHNDDSVEFILSSPGDIPACQTRGTGKEGIAEVFEVWRNKLSKIEKKYRDQRIANLHKKNKDLVKQENDKQENLGFDESDDEE